MVNELIHPLSIDIQPPSLFNNPFRYTPHPLCLAAMNEVQRHLLSTPLYSEEIAMGKMFGVLVVKNQHDEIGFLAAFSGLLNGSNNLPYFVPAIYDILNPDGHFKQGERLLDEINRQIREMEGSETYIGLKKECEETMQEKDETLRAMKEAATTKKALRNKLRTESNLTAEEEQRLIKESQFEKAEIKRTRDTFNRKIAEMQRMIETTELQLNLLKKERKNLSDQLQRWIFDQYVVFNAKGESKKLTDIFDEETASLPPAGAGECAAPKLLQYAFLHNLSPLCMAEFWWGKSPAQQLRRHLNFYPACSGKCKPILHFMLQGLKVADSRNESPITTLSPSQTSLISETSPSTPNLPIIYEDDCLIVVNKPSGMLSVKGKGDTVSIEGVLAQRWGKDHIPYMVHRLDMDTSGLLIIAKDKRTQQALQAQFANHKVTKRYKAIVEGDIKPHEGDINLPLRPDIMDRPRQMVDKLHGKTAITHFKVVMKRTDEQGRTQTVLHLFPKTGRTHQLRVHCAHPEGLNAPIVGDYLYGTPDQRLLLHAEYIELLHPATSSIIHFEAPADF